MAAASAGRSIAGITATYRRTWRVLDPILAVVCGALVLVAHNVGYALRVPYWLDESWVAASTRFPLTEVRNAIGPSPVLWTFLLRIDVIGGPERQRIVPLVFAGAAVAVAYCLFRTLGHAPPTAAVFGAGPVLLSPALLVRNDLKQYTADAFVFVLLLLLVARLDARWSTARLVTLAVVAAVSPGLSSEALFGATAAFFAVAISALVSREWRRLRGLVVAATGVVVGYCFWLFVFVLPNTNQALTDYWDGFYPSWSLPALHHFFSLHAAAIARGTGVHSPWAVALLVVVGALTLLTAGHTATALMLPIAFVGTMLAGLLRLAPFLDARTSTWLIVGCDVLMAIGVVGIARLVARIIPVLGAPIAIVASVAVAVAFAHVSWPSLRLTSTIPYENTREPSRYVEQHRGPHDVVVLNFGASFGFGYYSGLPIHPVKATVSATDFYVAFRPQDRVVVATQPAAVEPAMEQAYRMVAPYPGAHIWIIRTHFELAEIPKWTHEFTGRRIVSVIPNVVEYVQP